VFVPAGATPDIVARLVGQSLSQRIGQSIVIDNRPGAGGNLALQAVARAPADGYTLLQVATTHAINVTLYEKNTVTVTREIVPIASTNRDFFVLPVNPSFPAKTIAEFIAYAKANPGKINIASNGTGNLTHLAGELFRMMTGIEIVHVPYRGTPAAHSALIAGDVHAMFAWLLDSAYPSRHAAGAWSERHDAPTGAAGRAADRRCCHGLRGDWPPRHRRAQEHSGRNRGAIEP
jgi:tripartite-type tricarboxylate transporter receptor subunit TctC